MDQEMQAPDEKKVSLEESAALYLRMSYNCRCPVCGSEIRLVKRAQTDYKSELVAICQKCNVQSRPHKYDVFSALPITLAEGSMKAAISECQTAAMQKGGSS